MVTPKEAHKLQKINTRGLSTVISWDETLFPVVNANFSNNSVEITFLGLFPKHYFNYSR